MSIHACEPEGFLISCLLIDIGSGKPKISQIFSSFSNSKESFSKWEYWNPENLNFFFKIVFIEFYWSKWLDIEVWCSLDVQWDIPRTHKRTILIQTTNFVESACDPGISWKMGCYVPDVYPQVLHRSPIVINFFGFVNLLLQLCHTSISSNLNSKPHF